MLTPTSPDALEALRQGYDVEVGCTAYSGTTRLLLPLEVMDGEVTMTGGSGVRAVLRVTFAPAPGLTDALVPGVTLRPSWVQRYGYDGVEVIRWGDFDVDERSVSYDQDTGGVTVVAPDTFTRVSRRRLRAETPRGNPVDIAARWAREAHTALGGELLEATTTTVYGQLYEGDREEAFRTLLASVGMVGYVDRLRRLVISSAPDLTAPAVWELDALGRSGVLESATRSTSRTQVVNSYTVAPAVPGWFQPFLMEDTTPTSPTRVTGPMGYLTADAPLVFPGLRTAAEAAVAARVRLRRTTALASSTSVQAAANPYLDPGDAVYVTLPPRNGDAMVTEKALITQVRHPLTPGEPQTLELRSTYPLMDEAA